jgi:hypothetical protein
MDGKLTRPRLRYTELNRLRDELQHIRSDVAGAWAKSSRSSMPIAIR